jgi:ribosome-associated heat shock protein Hsp15
MASVEAQRLDKWLWHARLVRTRTAAAALVAAGKIRVNRERTVKSSHAVKPGDVVTASVGGRVRVLRVLAFAERRGSANATLGLYEELTAPADRPKSSAQAGISSQGPSGEPAIRSNAPAPEARPDKRDRRRLAQLRGKPR